MKRVLILLVSALSIVGMFAQTSRAEQPVAVTIEVESLAALFSGIDKIGAGAGLPLNRQLVEMSLQQNPMFGDLKNLQHDQPIRAYVFLPAAGPDGASPKAPDWVVVMPVKSGGTDYVDALKSGYTTVEAKGKTVHLTESTVPGAIPSLFLQAVDSSVFLASGVESLNVIRDRHSAGDASMGMPKLIGAVKFMVDVDAVWPMMKAQMTSMAESMPAGPTAGMPNDMNPKDILNAEVEFFETLVKDVKNYGFGLKPRRDTLDFYSRFEVKPNTTLAKAMAKTGLKENRYTKILPSDGYFTVVSGGLQVMEDFIEPYTAFMETLLAGAGESGDAPSSKDMMDWVQTSMGHYAGDMGLTVISKPSGDGVGFIEYFHLKDPAEFEKSFAGMMASVSDLYKNVAPGFSLKTADTREYKGVTITGIAYAMEAPAGAAADPASAMVLSMLSALSWEFAVVGEDMVYTMGGPEFMDLAIDRLKAPAGPGFMAAAPFVTLIPKVKSTPTGAFSLSLIPMLKAIFAAMPNVQPEMLNAIPEKTGGMAGFSFRHGNTAAGVARLSYSEIKGLVSSGQVIGGMVTQMMMGGMMQGAGAGPQAVPANTECRRNLRMIDGAKEQFGTFDVKLEAGDAVDPKGLSTYFPGGSIPTCSEGGQYSIGVFGAAPACSVPGHGL